MTAAAPSSGPQQQGGQDNKKARTLWEAQRAALAEAFPAWKIVCVAHLPVPLWFALYREPLTPHDLTGVFRVRDVRAVQVRALVSSDGSARLAPVRGGL